MEKITSGALGAIKDFLRFLKWAVVEKRHYQLRQLNGLGAGTFPVYESKDEKNKHYLCAACFEEWKRSPLSFSDEPVRPYCPVHGEGISLRYHPLDSPTQLRAGPV